MRIETIGLQHQNLLRAKLASLELPISEYSFAYLYLFRTDFALEVVFNKRLYIKGKTSDGVEYYMPTEPTTAIDFIELQQSIGKPITFFPIPEQWLPNYPQPIFTHETMPADSDYLFTLDHLRHYPGPDMDGPRHQVQQFKKLYYTHSTPLSTNTLLDATRVLEHWQNGQESDYAACKEALELYDVLGLKGMVYEVNGAPSAFIISEPANSYMHVLHFAKANTDFKGIYRYIHQHYAQTLPDNYQWINLEEDMGIPGIRQAKLSYHPAKIAAKWRIRLA